VLLDGLNSYTRQAKVIHMTTNTTPSRRIARRFEDDCEGSRQTPTLIVRFISQAVEQVATADPAAINRNETHLCPAGCGSRRYPRADGTFPRHKARFA
jgi:hypothetical protein